MKSAKCPNCRSGFEIDYSHPTEIRLKECGLCQGTGRVPDDAKGKAMSDQCPHCESPRMQRTQVFTCGYVEGHCQTERCLRRQAGKDQAPQTIPPTRPIQATAGNASQP